MTEQNIGAVAPAAEAQPQTAPQAAPQTAPQTDTAPAPEQITSPSPAADVRAPKQVANGEGEDQDKGGAADEDVVPNLLDDAAGDEPPSEQTPDGNGTLGAPEGGYKLEPSPGTDVHMDEEAYTKFSEIAKELNLSQTAAQKLVSGMEPILKRSIVRNAKAWAAASRQDAEFGGAAFEQNMKAVNRTYVATTSPELREVLKASGLVNHPEMIRHFYGLSKVLSDGRFITSKGVGEGADGSDPRSFYKGMKNP